MDFLTQTKDVIYANFVTLQQAGLFELDHIKEFTLELGTPFMMIKENQTVAFMQSILLGQTMDLYVRRRPTGHARVLWAWGSPGRSPRAATRMRTPV